MNRRTTIITLVFFALSIPLSISLFRTQPTRPALSSNTLGYNECVKYFLPNPAEYCEAGLKCVETGTKALRAELDRTDGSREKMELLSRLAALNSYQNSTLAEAENNYKQAIALIKDEDLKAWPGQLLRLRLAGLQMRLGELQNCVHHHNAESCLFPLTKSAEHQFTQGSEKALATLGQILKTNPNQIIAKWLYNVAAMTLGQYPQRVPKEILISPDLFLATGGPESKLNGPILSRCKS